MHILRAETDLRNNWRHHLLAAYNRRKASFERGSSISRAQQIRTLISVLVGVGFTLIGIGLSFRGILQDEENFLWFCCGGPLLSFLGLLTLGAALLSHKSRRNPKTNRVPLHPLRSGSIRRGIYPDIRARWLEGLSGDLMDEVPDYPDYLEKNKKDHGAQGERDFIQGLGEIFDDRFFVLARLMQRPREDVDVILIGPKGVWVFEVKHWSGEIYWDDHGWRRVQTYYERGGVEVTKQPDVGEPPDQQWIRAASEVSRTLHSHANQILARYPSLEQVRGGILFTKEDAVLNIQSGRPVFWGTLNFWIKTLQDVEQKANLDTRSTLQLMETLLARHHELAPDQQMRSMLTYAQSTVEEADEQFRVWVQL